MHTVSIGEIQKNITLITQLDEAVTIMDRRRNRQVAVVYPMETQNVVSALAGKYRKRVKPQEDLQQAKEEAMREAMAEKYGLSD